MFNILKFKQILFITPKTGLTSQSSDKFYLYDNDNKINSDWSCAEIHSKAKKLKSYKDINIIFGNYQSLCKKKEDFFNNIDCVIIDECHHSTANSLKSIASKCKNAKYKIGLTGTFPEIDSYNSFIIQSYIGPVVYNITSYDLINKEKFATPVYITSIFLDYLEEEKKISLYNLRKNKDKDDITAGNKLLQMERELVRNSEKRFKYISNMIMHTNKNSLVIFSDIQNEYGKKYYNYLKEKTEKSVYYIDGNILNNNRDYYISQMENDETNNTIIVASIGCFSEGIDIGNLSNIFLIESTKSEISIAQLLGRGMRNHINKNKTIMIDFVDDFKYGTGYYAENYLYKHGKQRINIYNKRKFPNNNFNIKF